MENFVGICSHEEANTNEITQLGISACGATAIANCLLFLNVVTAEEIRAIDFSKCIVRRRKEDSPLPEYLLSRYNAGCTGEELCESMQLLTELYPLLKEKLLVHEFVSYHDITEGKVLNFLEHHLQSGHGLVATMNLQLFGNDAWHHQLIYGVDSEKKLIYMTNPMTVYDEETMKDLISTPRVLLIRREDVLKRIHLPSENEQIYSQDAEWCKHNIPSQIQRLLKDDSIPYLIIPAAYTGGFALFSKKILN